MLKLFINFKVFLRSNKGQGMVEYSLIIAFVVLAVMFTIQLLGNEIKDVYYSTFVDLY